MRGSSPPPIRTSEVAVQPLGSTPAQGIADVVWTAQNYHDFHTPLFGPPDVAKVNKAVFEVLKPGGVYIVLDHAAEDGSGLRDVNTLHRIDPETVKSEVVAAGFVFDGESTVLRNRDDKRTPTSSTPPSAARPTSSSTGSGSRSRGPGPNLPVGGWGDERLAHPPRRV